MGMYTTVIRPDSEGAEVQIKTGRDDCDTYRVGDAVNWSYDIVPMRGTLLDGVYRGLGNELKEFFVIIKDHKIAAVLPVPEECYDGDGAPTDFAYQCKLEADYGIKPPPFDAWSDSAWAKLAQSVVLQEQEHKRFEAECYGMAPEQKIGFALAYLSRQIRERDSFARQIFPPVERANG